MNARNDRINRRNPPYSFKPAALVAGFAAVLLIWPSTGRAEMPGEGRVQPLLVSNQCSFQVDPARTPRRPKAPMPSSVAYRKSALQIDETLPDPCIDIEEKSITSVTTNILAPSGEMPKNCATAKMGELAGVSYDAVAVRQWGGLQYCWDAPVLCHGPLYFEEVNLERHGYGPKYLRVIQPVVSGAQFFATVPMLPYKIVAEPPRHPVYTLGRYRPGNIVPYRVNYPPLSPKGGVAEAGLAIGLVFLIP